MTVDLISEKLVTVSDPVIVEVKSPSSSFCVVFEDDGDSAYFYAVDLTNGDQIILDALHVYDARGAGGDHRLSTIRVGWSRDGLKALLTIDDYPHAIFDFQSCNGYCRTGFPPSNQSWSLQGHAWSERALKLFD